MHSTAAARLGPVPLEPIGPLVGLLIALGCNASIVMGLKGPADGQAQAPHRAQRARPTDRFLATAALVE